VSAKASTYRIANSMHSLPTNVCCIIAAFLIKPSPRGHFFDPLSALITCLEHVEQ